MRQNEIFQNASYAGVSALLDEGVDPGLKSTVQSERSTEDFVLGEDQKERAHSDAAIRPAPWHSGLQSGSSGLFDYKGVGFSKPEQ